MSLDLISAQIAPGVAQLHRAFLCRGRFDLRRRSECSLVRTSRISLRQRKWDCADGNKQKQEECASKKMRFQRGVNLFFHSVTVMGVRGPFSKKRKNMSRHFGYKLETFLCTTDLKLARFPANRRARRHSPERAGFAVATTTQLLWPPRCLPRRSCAKEGVEVFFDVLPATEHGGTAPWLQSC